MTSKRVRVIIADDHSIVLEGLRYILSKEDRIEVVGTASEGLSAVNLAETRVPDIMIMDYKMPGLDGIAAAEKILQRNPTIRVIILSGHMSSTTFHRGLKIGIMGFVDKESGLDEVIRAVKEASLGRNYYCGRVRSLMAANLRQKLNPSAPQGRMLSLEDQELVTLLTDGRTIGHIAIVMNKSPKTIDARRRKIMQQLGLSSLAELTKYAINEGLTSLELSCA